MGDVAVTDFCMKHHFTTRQFDDDAIHRVHEEIRNTGMRRVCARTTAQFEVHQDAIPSRSLVTENPSDAAEGLCATSSAAPSPPPSSRQLLSDRCGDEPGP
jgi:hypothetical protein